MTDQEQLRVRDETNDSYGHQSIRVEHLFAGSELPIFVSCSLAEFTRERALLHIQPGFHEDLSKVARTAAFTQIAAEQTAIDHTRRACSLGPAEVATIKTTTLGVAAEPQGGDLRLLAANFVTPFTTPVETYLLGNWDITSPHQGAAVDGHVGEGGAGL